MPHMKGRRLLIAFLAGATAIFPGWFSTNTLRRMGSPIQFGLPWWKSIRIDS